MKKLYLLTFLISVFISASAQQVGSVAARKAAEAFWKLSFANAGNFDLAYCLHQQSDTSLFIYNAGTTGFVIVSGDYTVSPVLAYSTEGNYKFNNQSPASLEWLQNYSEQILSGRNNRYKVPVNPEWAVLLSDNMPVVQNKSSKTVNPLVTTKWDQGTYYNYKCPAYPSGPDGHCVTGCVATAMAQIMKYYNYPETGVGSHWYSHPHFGNIGADFAATTYNWANMSTYANLTNQESIGTLMFHCGVSVDMDYSPTASGAFTENAVTAFKNYFHYRNTVKIIEKNDYSEFDWIAMLKDDLEEGHPILYSGSGAGGHAWVCSGYDANDRFHMNWGWSGMNNGYYLVSNLNPGGSTFNLSQKAIINIAPYFAPYCINGRVFTDSTRMISDGSGYSYYWNDTDCDWLITPTGAEKVVLQFTDFNTETANDIVSVYDGQTTSDALLGTFSGSSLPPVLTASSGKMLLTFSSNNSTQGLGWTAKYWALKHGAGITEHAAERVMVYPNPATTTLTVSTTDKGNTLQKLIVFDHTGREVIALAKNGADDALQTIDISKLKSGLYVLSAESANSSYRAKFIKR